MNFAFAAFNSGLTSAVVIFVGSDCAKAEDLSLPFLSQGLC